MFNDEEDFSLVVDEKTPSKDSLEDIKASIDRYKRRHEQLIQEQQEILILTEQQRETTREFRRRSDRLLQDLEKDQRSYEQQIEDGKAEAVLMQQEEKELLKEIQRVEEALKEEDAQNQHLQQQVEVFTAVPERPVVFVGTKGSNAFQMKSRVVYPMEGGTALVTFEDEVVASRILDMKEHRVALGSECSIALEARRVQLVLPQLVEIDSEVSPRHILISNLPKMETETLLNKLEIHFSKKRHGGGEVEKCELLPDSEDVVITFVESDVARGLTEREHHQVELQRTEQSVRVTPFLNGTITGLQTRVAVCRRTVLLTGIPGVMEPESLLDLLEIHFQRKANGGGEIEAFLYNPPGGRSSALFEGVSAA
uniref:Interferon-induced protein 35 n=1 Tax=Gasterosteus aculeatus aculeatus TaxID=481459 RepID=A0AAQ4RXT4_GASAC|nr:interferon-induced protein 35 [Gasterosteus aculeatus aculeatus]